MVGDQILRDKIFATPLSVQTLSRQEPFPTTTQSKTTVDVVQVEVEISELYCRFFISRRRNSLNET